MGNSIEIQAPAKVNLFLEVVSRRPDGYHDLQSIFQAVSLYDNLVINLTSGRETTLRCNLAELQTPHNLVMKAAGVFRRATGFSDGIDIRLEKRIPLQAGLGGGSSDAAAVLVALNDLTAAGFDCGRLRSMGAEVGSDVPFFIEGGTALVEGRGERVAPFDMRGKLYFVIFFPGFGVLTADVYKNLRLKLTEIRDDATLLAAELSQGNLAGARSYFFNRLEKTAFALESRLDQARASMHSRMGEARVMLCGSGASLFSVFLERDIALRGYEALKGMSAGEVFFAESIRGRGCAAGPERRQPWTFLM